MYGDAGPNPNPGINPSRTTLTLTLDTTLILVLDAWPFERAGSNVLTLYDGLYNKKTYNKKTDISVSVSTSISRSANKKPYHVITIKKPTYQSADSLHNQLWPTPGLG